MKDAFALLDLPRRPWLAPAVVRSAFQTRARALHPDSAAGDAEAFTALNSAQRALSTPAARLRLLLPGVAIPAAPPDIEMGFRIGAFLREADKVLTDHHAARTPLDRALVAGEIARLRRAAAELTAAVADHTTASEARLRALDASWPAVAVEDLAALAGAFTFLDRWTAQLRERRLALQIVGNDSRSEAEIAEGKAFPSNPTGGKRSVVSHSSSSTPPSADPDPGRKRPAHHPTVEIFNRTSAIFLTCCTKDRRPLLARSEIHAILRTAWHAAAAWRVGHYILMPDHLHLLCAPSGPDALPLASWVKYWKTLASRDWPHPGEQPIWQNDFWDTQLRHSEHYTAKWDYLRNNPVRAGLCARPEDWPHQGHIYEIAWHD